MKHRSIYREINNNNPSHHQTISESPSATFDYNNKKILKEYLLKQKSL